MPLGKLMVEITRDDDPCRIPINFYNKLSVLSSFFHTKVLFSQINFVTLPTLPNIICCRFVAAYCRFCNGQVNGVEATTPEQYFSVNGTRLAAPQKGVNIVKMSDHLGELAFFMPTSFSCSSSPVCEQPLVDSPHFYN